MQFPRWSLLALLVLALSPAWGQSKYVPVLHRRVSQMDNEFDYATRSVGRTALPSEASGEYALGGGGTIDIDLQPDRLSGFITRVGDRESDEGTPLTFFFCHQPPIFAAIGLHHAAGARCLVDFPGNDRARLRPHSRPARILPAAGPVGDARCGQPDRTGAHGLLAPGSAKS